MIFAYFLIIFGILIIIFPELIAYLLGFFLIFIGINILIINYLLKSSKKSKEKVYYDIFGFKIFKE